MFDFAHHTAPNKALFLSLKTGEPTGKAAALRQR